MKKRNPKTYRGARVIKTELKKAAIEQEQHSPVVIEQILAKPDTVFHNENLLEKFRSQWQIGEWESLVTLDRSILAQHPDRAKLALITASAWLQLSNDAEARYFLKLAQDWGCDKKLISRVLIAGVHNSLGRAAAITNQESRTLKYFGRAVSLAIPCNDIEVSARIRQEEQLFQLGLPSIISSDTLFARNRVRKSTRQIITSQERVSANNKLFFDEVVPRKWTPANRIAIVRLDNIGDHVLGSPLFRGLRFLYPKAEIVLVANEAVSTYYKKCPWIDNLIIIPNRDSSDYTQEKLYAIHDMITERAKGKFDILINPRFAEDYYHACLISSYIDASYRIAFHQDRTVIDGLDSNSFYNELLTASSNSFHVVCYSHILLRYLGVSEQNNPEVWYDDEELKSVCLKSNLTDIDSSLQLIVVIGIGASQPSRVWPVRHYSEFIKKLATLITDVRIYLVGSEAERLNGDTISSISNNCVNLVGNTTLVELSALCSIANIYIGPDSGPKHIAAAAGCPVIEISHQPVGRPSQARSSDTMGECWSAVNVFCKTIKPAANYSDRQIARGEAIASISPDKLLSHVVEFIHR